MIDLDWISKLIGAMCTVAVLSYFYRENPFYRLFEHIFIGLTAGHAIVMGVRNVQTMAITKIVAGNIIYVVPVLIGLLIYTRFYRKYLWLSRYPYAFLIGTATGLGMAGQFDSVLFQQTVATFMNLGNINGLIVAIGTVLCMLYFFLSREQKGAYGKATMLGRYFIMLYFGVYFGNISMGRISVMIWNLYILTGDPQKYVVIVSLFVAAAAILYSSRKQVVKVPVTP